MNSYLSPSETQLSNQPHHDLRSDTVTLPDIGMREAMYDAEVGDDVYGDDPTVARLETHVAERLGKDAALFVPSGTMSNLCALLAHCGRGEEVIVGRGYHIAAYEAAGSSVLGGIAICTIPVGPDGALSSNDISNEIKPDDSHLPISRLVGLENTHNGQAVSLDRIAEAATAGRVKGLSVHLDGARFFNAIAELECAERDLADLADSVSICLSKGLGTPAGSVLTGPADIIDKARRYRKMLGGGMRQSGVLAAAGLYALETNVARLSQDHAHARQLADDLTKVQAGTISQSTNMIFLTPRDQLNDDLRHHMAKAGITIGGRSTGAIRIVVHKGIDDEALKLISAEMQSFFA